MASRLPAAVVSAVMLAAAACSPAPERRAAEPTGAQAYERYCASCHGESGRGDGPVAASLTTAPADLTRLAARTGGRFDEAAVMAAIDGRQHVAAHGPREMPVWGAIFESDLRAAGERYPRYVTLLSVGSLVEHLRGLQAEPTE